ncbi:MAG: TlpA family protein disulfide reductase [Gaiellaceae bacterium]
MRALLLAAALVAVVAGCGSDSGGQASPPGSTATEAGAPDDASNRPPAPDIEGTSLDGERISLAGYRGRPVFVNVWSSW